MSRILFLSRWFPDPPDNGSKLRIFNLLRGLANRHDVTLLSFSQDPAPPSSDTLLSSLCTRIEVIPWKPYDPASLRARLGFLSLRPRFVVDTYSSQMQAAIARALSSQSFDAVIASQMDMALYSPWFENVPALFEEVELATLYEQYSQAPSLARRLRYGLTWAKHRRFLRRRLQDFKACTVVSQHECRLLQRVAPHFSAISIIPNCIDVAACAAVQAVRQENRLIFSGSLTYDANYEAMTWFLERVFPLIKEQIPHVDLLITGDHGHRPLPNARDVTLTGFVDDVKPLVAGASVSLAPILTGGGTRLKILEAMALGTPVVATEKGAEGLDVRHGEHLLVAGDAREFARAVVHLLQNPQERQRLAEDAFCLVREHYNWPNVMPQFLDLVDFVIDHDQRAIRNAVPGFQAKRTA